MPTKIARLEKKMKEIIKYVSINGIECDTKEEAAIMDHIVMTNAIKVITNYCRNYKNLCHSCPFMGEKMCKFFVTNNPIESDEGAPRQWDI